jgi:two-component system KDP operon response regulator KdpE
VKILIIEDDKGIIESFKLNFEVSWPEAEVLASQFGEEGIQLVDKEDPDLILIDLGLPDISGFEVIKAIRSFSRVPIIVVSVKQDEDDIVKALMYGADDYLTKPPKKMELLARIKTVFRRLDIDHSLSEAVHGPFHFNKSLNKLFFRDHEIRLTTTEGLILYHLTENMGKVVSYISLSKVIWGDDYPNSRNAIRIYISNLRHKLNDNAHNPKVIVSQSGVGYMVPRLEN